MPESTTTDTTPPPPYDRAAIFHPTGPFNPGFMREAIRAMFRTLPLDQAEPKGWSDRRMHAALLGLSALHPRDEIEVMLGVQAMSAHHAAMASWHLGMNLAQPHGSSTRHFAAACSAARTFETMLRALERRQAKPLGVPIGRPTPKTWEDAPNPTSIIAELEESVRADEDTPDPPGQDQITWTPEALTAAHAQIEQDRIENENRGLDIANTEGILPGGGMILTDDPTPQQAAYMGRRLNLMYQRESAENRQKGITTKPIIRPIRPGDLIP
jgi:hypothetical protein